MSHHAIKGESESDTYQRAEAQGMDLDDLSDIALVRRLGTGGEGIGSLNKLNRKRLVRIGLIVRARGKGGFIYSLTDKGRDAIKRVKERDSTK
jgi:predicted transcriptional regulator with HTH domain